MDQKKTFTEPACEVTRFSVEDIVTTSGWNTQEFGILDVENVVE